MRKYRLLLFTVVMLFCPLCLFAGADTLMRALFQTLGRKEQYQKTKETRIVSIKKLLETPELLHDKRLDIYNRLSDEYSSIRLFTIRNCCCSRHCTTTRLSSNIIIPAC